MAQSSTRTDRLRIGAAVTLLMLEGLGGLVLLALVVTWL